MEEKTQNYLDVADRTDNKNYAAVGNYGTDRKNYHNIPIGGKMVNTKEDKPKDRNDFFRFEEMTELPVETVEFVQTLMQGYRDVENARYEKDEDEDYRIGENDFYIHSLTFDDIVKYTGYDEDHVAEQIQVMVSHGYLDNVYHVKKRHPRQIVFNEKTGKFYWERRYLFTSAVLEGLCKKTSSKKRTVPLSDLASV